MSGQLLAQIEAMKQAMANGMLMPGGQGSGGQAGSGWGLGTSPYAAQGSESGATAPESRLGSDSLMDTGTIDYQQLYESTDLAHGTIDQQVSGQLDLTQTPKKVEDVRSAPETQASMLGYSNVISAYAEGEEAAIQREQIPLEYQELVGQYFDQIQKDAEKNTGAASEPEDTGETEPTGEGESADNAG